jgi:HPt (histidine-containing phosphotransfer) domain-containing protein|tara:strand:+ start:362 stop:754 length:393 start_codon:yes stop_codon:yes gene_type:complete
MLPLFFIEKGMFVETKQSNPDLDLELLQGYLDSLGKTIVEQMFALYCQQVEVYLNDIERAQLNNSLSGWQEHCHKMKGAAASVGMYQLHGQLKLLEKTDASTEKKALLLEDLRLSNGQAILAFQKWLESL